MLPIVTVQADALSLQMQVDEWAMEQGPTCTACMCNTNRVVTDTRLLGVQLPGGQAALYEDRRAQTVRGIDNHVPTTVTVGIAQLHLISTVVSVAIYL